MKARDEGVTGAYVGTPQGATRKRNAESHGISKAAGIAQLVERNLAKVEVTGSSPVARFSAPVGGW
jgi:hypothetical protein